MPIAKGQSQGPICPAGTFDAVCVDVIDLGENETPFTDEKTGKKKWAHQIQIVWMVDARDDDGEPVTRNDGKMHRLGQFYTLSLNEKANLRKDLDSWRGVAFTDAELEDGWDVDQVVGAQCQLNVIHKNDSKGNPRARINAVLARRKGKGFEPVIPDEYTREMDRPGGRDMRSPPGEDEGGKVPVGNAAKKSYEDYEPEEDEQEQDDLPF